MEVIKKVKPLFNGVITTMDRYDTVVKGGIIDASKSGAVKEFQKVIAIGPMVRGIEVGDTVCIDPIRYAIFDEMKGSIKAGVKQHNAIKGYNFNVVEIYGMEHLYLNDNDIRYVAEIEEVQEPSIVTQTKPLLV